MLNKIIFAVLISLIFNNCSIFRNKTVFQSKNTDTDVVLDTVYVRSEATSNDNSKNTTTPKNVSIKVVFTNSYCGGVRPSEVTLEEYKKEFPLVNSTILFHDTNDKSKYIEAITDSSGLAIAPLKAGVYNYFMTAKYSKTMGCAFNSTCAIWLKRSFGQVTIVKNETDGYKIAYNFGCNPCEPKRP